MANLSGAVGLVLTIVVASGIVAGETFRFPEFVAIEGTEVGSVCGGWIIDNALDRWPYLLTTEICIKSQNRQLSQLLVRYGSAEVTRRTNSLGIDRMLSHLPDDDRLVMLSTIGVRYSRPEPTPAYNGTVVLYWRKQLGDGNRLLKSLLLVPEDQQYALGELLTNRLLCGDAVPDTQFLLEGGVVLRNSNPIGLLSVRSDSSSTCGNTLDVLAVVDVHNKTTFTDWAFEPKHGELDEGEASSWFSEPNSPFGYIVYVIFLSYCILYTVLYFILALGRSNPSTNL
ncbi:uncharacterized protein LOC128730159 [Anopheles nili]|uniref:uncharacterized protein LOC128730159 n=1 Tax=Anopheles nili TaxID=185578 RepID=UPI00237B143D|nr:uncharacterized protein LOC128730159 [Anopheles nili]